MGGGGGPSKVGLQFLSFEFFSLQVIRPIPI